MSTSGHHEVQINSSIILATMFRTLDTYTINYFRKYLSEGDISDFRDLPHLQNIMLHLHMM